MLERASAEICAFWAAAELDSLSIPVSWAGPDPAPMWLDMARDYTEYWVHQQQIREAVGAPLLDEPRLRGPVVDIFMRALPHALREVDAAEGDPVAYTVTGDSGGDWVAVRDGGIWVLDRRSVAAPNARVSTEADTFWRLCVRGVAAAESVVRQGDKTMTAAATAMVSVIL